MVWATRKDVRTAEPVFLTTMLHQLHSKMQTVVPLSRSGAKTMHIGHQACTSAATAAPAKGADPIQLHAEAHNALNMAVYYLRQPQANVPGAARKAVQALAALRRLDCQQPGGVQ